MVYADEATPKYTKMILQKCNTLVLSMHWALAFHEHKHHPSIHEHEHKKLHLIHFIFITRDVAFIYMLAIGCDQCMK